MTRPSATRLPENRKLGSNIPDKRRARTELAAVLDAIRSRDRFLVTSHARPDGDAVGSVLALWMVLKSMGKRAEMQLYDSVPLIYRNLPEADRIRIAPAIGASRNPDAVILLECDGIARTRLKGLEDRFLINIDHHASSCRFANVNWIENEASAVSEMVYRLAVSAGVSVTADMATCMYAALVSDTGSFCYEGTVANTFALAKTLVELGAHPARIAQDIYLSSPASKMRLLGMALATLRIEGPLAWLSVTHADMIRADAGEEDCQGIVNYAVGIAGVQAAVFLRELPDHRIRMSLRSKDSVHVDRVAERFGGGGHTHASGCTLEGPLDEARDRILSELRRQIGESVTVAG
jgi:phosphoesterase RecJ-like protein